MEYSETVELPSRTERALDRWIRGLRPGTRHALPALADTEPLLLVRWLYRRALHTSRRWFPLLHLEASRLPARDPDTVLDDIRRQAAAGWLFTDLELEPTSFALLTTDEPPFELPTALGPVIRRQDAYHLVATDPTLDPVRRSLLSHCRTRSLVYLQGAPGSGRRGLASWAHATLDDRPLSRLHRGGDPRPRAGRWQLYDPPDQLDVEQLHHLQTRLFAEEPTASFGTDTSERSYRPNHEAFETIKGHSPALSKVLRRALTTAKSRLPVLILGESGTGKEALARAVHELSGRSGSYWVADLSTLNEELIESELFGHVKGAFTGAVTDREGAFRKADGGTLFLDELGNLSPRIQAKLLRVLEVGRVQPVGEDRQVGVDVRVVAATNADLEAKVARGEFRLDLLRRLDAITLHLPPLRDRGDDVVELSQHFLEEAGGGTLSPEAEQILREHTWPGNVRELRNVTLVAALEADGTVRPEHLGPLAPRNQRPVPTIVVGDGDDLGPLDRRQAQRLRATTLTVAPLRERGRLAVRSAVLALLEGRPIRSDALAALERRPWWGNYTELVADLEAIRATIPGTVHLAALEDHLPHLVRRTSAEPIRVLLNPVTRPDGSISGLQETFDDGALLVGRVRSWRELQAVGRAEGGRSQARVEAIEAKLSGPPACLCLEHLSRLSRAHLLVTREGEDLLVHALPGVRAPLEAGSLDSEGPHPVTPGRPHRLGPAGELRVLTPDGTPYVQLFVFAGSVAFDDFAAVAASRTERNRQGVTHATRGAAGPAPAPRRSPTIWKLDDIERGLLSRVVLGYRSGDFKGHLEAGLAPHRQAPEFRRLVAYVLGARPTQYCARLYEHPDNAALRADLVAGLRKSGEFEARLETLPRGIRRSVESELS